MTHDSISDRDGAVDALYRDHHQRVVRLAFMLIQDTGIAEELAQEAFVKVWRAWDRVEDGRAFLTKTVVNLAKSSLRRRALEARHRGRPADAVHIDPAARLDTLRAIEQLPMRQRMCVALRFYEDLSDSQTAELMGISVGAVKSQTYKALRRLESILGGEA